MIDFDLFSMLTDPRSTLQSLHDALVVFASANNDETLVALIKDTVQRCPRRRVSIEMAGLTDDIQLNNVGFRAQDSDEILMISVTLSRRVGPILVVAPDIDPAKTQALVTGSRTAIDAICADSHGFEIEFSHLSESADSARLDHIQQMASFATIDVMLVAAGVDPTENHRQQQLRNLFHFIADQDNDALIRRIESVLGHDHRESYCPWCMVGIDHDDVYEPEPT